MMVAALLHKKVSAGTMRQILQSQISKQLKVLEAMHLFQI
jgi:hypothetical protein